MDWKKILKRVLLGILVAYVGLVIYRIPAVAEKQRTEEAVARIHAQKLTLDTVIGKYLPEAPDPAANDATVEGIDRNNNGIRDDVELAIFKKYPNSARIRAAELQYAMSLQTALREVFNSETWEVATQQKGRGYGCIFDSVGIKGISLYSNGVESLVFNTQIRKDEKIKIDKYRTSFAVLSGEDCDVTNL